MVTVSLRPYHKGLTLEALSPLLEKGVIARTDPDHPQSPQQRYCLT